jgi:hypothetical protein
MPALQYKGIKCWVRRSKGLYGTGWQPRAVAICELNKWNPQKRPRIVFFHNKKEILISNVRGCRKHKEKPMGTYSYTCEVK